jgi:outer membrane protein assembly factor BamB
MPILKGDSSRAGINPGTGPDHLHGRIGTVWSFDAGQAVSVVVSDNMVYIAGKDAVSAVQLADGALVWEVDTGGLTVATPAVDSDMVVLATSAGLFGLNAHKAEVLWHVEDRDDFSASSPAISGGLAFSGDDSGRFAAVRLEDGDVQDEFEGDGAFTTAPSVVGSAVAVADEDNILHVLDVGMIEHYNVPMPSLVVEACVIAQGGTLYAARQDGHLIAFDGFSGLQIWDFDAQGEITGSPSIQNGIIYLVGGGSLHAINSVDGRAVWAVPAEGSTPILANGMAVVGGKSGTLMAFDAASSQLVWSYQPNAEAPQTLTVPAVVGNLVLVGSADGQVYAIGNIPPSLAAGASAHVIAQTPLLGGPSPLGVEREMLSPGEDVHISGDAVTVDDQTWWPVTLEGSGRSGWVDAQALEPFWPDPAEPGGTPVPG